jgi:hypothetical protein
MTETAKFILAGLNPQGTFAALAEFKVVSNVAGARIGGIAMKSKVLSEGDRGDGRFSRDGGSDVVKEVGTGSM